MAENIIQQKRSILRLKLTGLIGMVVTIVSISVLLWLLGISIGGSQIERATVSLKINVDCPERIKANVHVDPYEGWIWISLLDPDIPSGYDLPEQNVRKRSLFTQCEVILDSLTEIVRAEVQTNTSGGTHLHGDDIPKNEALSIDFKKESRLHRLVIEAGKHPLFAGEFRLKTKEMFSKDSFGKFHMGLSLLVRNTGGLNGLDVSLSLPTTDMQARVILPRPAEIGTTPLETYHFEAKPSPFSEVKWIDQDYFIDFVNPGSMAIREGLLIVASTLFGAGVSAILEVFLAGGTSIIFRRTIKR